MLMQAEAAYILWSGNPWESHWNSRKTPLSRTVFVSILYADRNVIK